MMANNYYKYASFVSNGTRKGSLTSGIGTILKGPRSQNSLKNVENVSTVW